MNSTAKTAMRGLCSCALVLGLLALLIETRSTGEALETLKLYLLPGAFSTIAAGVSGLAIAGLAILYFSDHKGKPRHP